MHIRSPLAAACLAALCHHAAAQHTVVTSFNPSQNGGLCGTAYSPFTDTVFVYDCFGSSVGQYTPGGGFISLISVSAFGTANDVDIEIAPVDLVMNGVAVPAGSLLYINGESGTADIYAIDPDTGSLIVSLVTSFGAGHVVGGAYHPDRQTFFLVQDRVPGGAIANIVVEIDPANGSVLNSFSVGALGYQVDYGDLDVSTANGNLFLVSADESSVGEFTPTGALVAERPLPSGVTSLSGIGIDDANGRAWVGGTGGMVWLLSGFPVAAPCPADYNGDEAADILDFLDFMDDYGSCDQQPAPCGTLGDADINGDTAVDILDFLDFIDAFGQGC